MKYTCKQSATKNLQSNLSNISLSLSLLFYPITFPSPFPRWRCQRCNLQYSNCYWPDMIILSNHLSSYSRPPRWRGQMRNLQYSNCSCPLRSAEIMKLSGARRDNLCETNNPCDKNNPNCDCLIDASGKPQCDCKDKSCGPGQYSTDKKEGVNAILAQ